MLVPNWKEYPPPSRPVAMGVNGMVSSAHSLASLAGLQVLTEGGNAFDAATSVAATLGVVEPYMSGPGGIGLALAYVARERRTRVLNFSGRAPMAAEPSRFTPESKQTGILAALVPGNVAGWLTLHETYGSLDRRRLLQPAIDYAENGFPVSDFNSRIFAEQVPRVSRYPASASILLDRDGRPPLPGSLFRMPRLAGSLRKIAEGGKDVFYRGELAAEVVQGVRAMGGLLSESDLAKYEPQWQEPIRISYRGYEVLTTPPNSSGFQILQTLKLMESFEGRDLSFQHPDTIHALMEAIKLCVTDRIRYGGDPDYVAAPLEGLLSEGYAARQRQRIDKKSVSVVAGEHYVGQSPPGALEPGSLEDFEGGMTTHFAVADRDGNVVSVTQTLGGRFGSAVAVGETGIFLNNMCYWFDLEKGSPNLIGPGKRVDFVLAPTHTYRDGRFFLSMGTPGGWGILQTTVQLLMNVLDFGMDLQQAIEAPRFRYYAGKRVEMEERFPLQLRRALAAMGHEVDILDAWSLFVGAAHAVQADQDRGVFHGGADSRRDGLALGW